MSYLKFEKEQLINLEYSLNKEILRTNRAGAYTSSTIIGCNTRKYHGLLVCPIEKFGGEKHVLLSSLDESIIENGSEFNLGIHQVSGRNYEPKGHKYIRNIEFRTNTKNHLSGWKCGTHKRTAAGRKQTTDSNKIYTRKCH